MRVIGFASMRRADVLAEPEPAAAASRIQSFNSPVSLPQAEFAGADVAGHAFGGGADAGEFVVVDRAGAVHGDVLERRRAPSGR